MQKTTFSIEILIHDDASTDGTAAIIREYETKYPDIMNPIYQTENQYSKGYNIGETLLKEVKSKYIALCDGDDYWTDPYKLQKQVDFLEANEAYSMCFHNAMVQQENREDRIFCNLKTGDYSGFDILGNWAIPTASVVVRNHIIEDYSFLQNTVFGDIFLFLVLSEKGKLFCINETMSVYRRHPQGISMKNTITQHKKLIKQYRFMDKYFQCKYSKTFKNNIFNSRMSILFICCQDKKVIEFLKCFFSTFITSPILLIQRFRRFFLSRLDRK
jgi:glycosyltransferase involved in cell wall biosynthesis